MSIDFRPKIQNGPIAKRARTGATTHAAPRPASAPPSRRTKAAAFATIAPLWAGVSVGALAQTGLAALGLDEPLQSTEVVAQEKPAPRARVLLGLIGCGVLLAGGFMFSLRDHFIAHATAHKDVDMKLQLQQAEAEQQHLDMTLKRVSGPQALEQAAREAGLAPLEMERKKAVIGAKREAITEKAKTDHRTKSRAAEH